MTYEGPGLSLDTRAWLFPDTPALGRVHGGPALIAVEEGAQSITWQPRPGVLLVILAMGRSNDDLEGLAETVRELDEARWRALLGGPGSVLPPRAPAPLPTQGVLVAEGVVPGGSWRALLNLYSGRTPAVCIDTYVLSGESHDCADIDVPASSMAQPQLISFEPAQGGNFLVVPVAKSVFRVRFTQLDGTQAALPSMRTSGTGFEIVVIQLGSAAPPDARVALDSNGREVARQDLPAALAPPATPLACHRPAAPPTSVPAVPSPPGG